MLGGVRHGRCSVLLLAALFSGHEQQGVDQYLSNILAATIPWPYISHLQVAASNFWPIRY